MLDKISALKIRNMVAERRLTAMMLREVVVLTGLECLPSSTQTLEKEEVSAPREWMEADPVPPCWGSSGRLLVGEEVLNPQWLFQGVEAAVV